MTSREELKRKLHDNGLGRVAVQIAQLARPCYRIGRTPAPEEQIPIGRSKFGGSPDVPAGFQWPQVSNIKKPAVMEFVAQIRLADLPAPLPEPVPRDGLLSFFTHWSEGRVFHFAEGTRLQRTEGPAEAAASS